MGIFGIRVSYTENSETRKGERKKKDEWQHNITGWYEVWASWGYNSFWQILPNGPCKIYCTVNKSCASETKLLGFLKGRIASNNISVSGPICFFGVVHELVCSLNFKIQVYIGFSLSENEMS